MNATNALFRFILLDSQQYNNVHVLTVPVPHRKTLLYRESFRQASLGLIVRKASRSVVAIH